MKTELGFLANFPYDVRRLETGAFINTLRQEGTLALGPDPEGKHIKPWDLGTGIPAALDIICLEDTTDWTTYNLAKVVKHAQKGLDSLPDLGYKCVLTYAEGEHIFSNCFLITTRHSDWWVKYPLIHERSTA